MEERSMIQCDINTANLPQQIHLTLEAQYRQDSQHNTSTFLLFFSDSQVILAIAGIALSVDPL